MTLQFETPFDGESALIQRALKTGCRLVRWPIGHAYVPMPGRAQWMKPAQSWSLPATRWAEVFRQAAVRAPIAEGQGIAGRAWISGRPQWMTGSTADPGWPLVGLRTRPRILGGVAVPVTIDGCVVTVLEFCSTRVEPPDSSVIELLVRIARRLGNQLARCRTGTFFPGAASRPGHFYPSPAKS